jgi:hypothetical protein
LEELKSIFSCFDYKKFTIPLIPNYIFNINFFVAQNIFGGVKNDDEN